MFDRKLFKDAITGSFWKVLTPGRILDVMTSKQYVVSNLFEFIIENKVSLKDNVFHENIAIDSNKKINNEAFYNEWLVKLQKNKENQFSKDELLVGHTYLSDDGKTYLYLGWKYIQKWKIDTKNKKISLTKEKKVYLAGETLKKIDYSSPYGNFCKVLELNSKIKIVEKTKANKQSVSDFLEVYELINNCVYFSDNKGSNSNKFKMVEITKDIELLEKLDKLNISYLNVFFKSKVAYIVQKTCVDKLINENPFVSFEVSSIHNCVYDLDLNKVKINNPFEWSSNLNEFIDEEEYLRRVSVIGFKDGKNPPSIRGLAKKIYIPKAI